MTAHAQNLDAIGVTLLRMVTTNVDGTGIRVAQPEASGTNIPPDFEVNPANSSVQQPVGLFTYITNNGTTNIFPNNIGYGIRTRGHCGLEFLRVAGRRATNVAHVDNYDANYFIQVYETINGSSTNYTASLPSSNINDPVVNQSFIFSCAPLSPMQTSH